MSDAILWKCSLSGTENLTVGSIFQLSCEGSLEAKLALPLQLEFPEKTAPFTLVLLDVKELKENSFVLDVTSYRAGKMNLPYLRVSGGESLIESGELKFEVQSVLSKESKPFGPFGPFSLSLPEILIYTAIFAGAVVVSLLGYFFYRHRKKIALQSALELNSSHLPPLRQFEAHLRKLRRQTLWGKEIEPTETLKILEEVQKALRIYFLRKMNMDTLKLNQKAFRKLIMKASLDRNAWVRFFNELTLSLKKPGDLDRSNLSELVDQASALVSQFESQKGER